MKTGSNKLLFDLHTGLGRFGQASFGFVRVEGKVWPGSKRYAASICDRFGAAFGHVWERFGTGPGGRWQIQGGFGTGSGQVLMVLKNRGWT